MTPIDTETHQRRGQQRASWAVVAIVVALVVVAGTTFAFLGSGVQVANGATGDDASASPAQAVATELSPSVVNIAVSGTTQGQQYAGEGSGVIYSSDGTIITNNHVVTDTSGDPVGSMKVTLATGEKLPATILGRDPLTDLAVIKVDADMDLPAAAFHRPA